MSVLVVGSFITDLVARCERAPQAGETVNGLSFNSFLGGKGANQAVACKRMGAQTTMAGCVGCDVYGDRFIDFFRREGFDVTHIKRSADKSTGCSLVTVETSGQNRICMVSGANTDFSAADVYGAEELVRGHDLIVTQGETPFEATLALAELCRKYSKKFIFNPAPARPLPDSVLQSVYVLTPNETELGVITGRNLSAADDYVAAAKELVGRGAANVVVTLGAKGALLVNGAETHFVQAYKVKAVDTVGAGDSFTGSLAAFTDLGFDLPTAMQKASAVGALAVQKEGAIPSMPYRSEVDAFLREING